MKLQGRNSAIQMHGKDVKLLQTKLSQLQQFPFYLPPHFLNLTY